MGRFDKFKLARRAGCLCAALLLLAGSLSQGSYAWRSASQTASNIFVLQEASGAVRLTKYEQGAETRLANAVYDLYRADGTRLPGRYTTDAQGEILVEGLTPGEYFLREVRTPYGYGFADADNRLDFTVPEGETEPVELRAENVRQTAQLTIQKKMDDAQTDPAHGFRFRVWIGDDAQAVFPYTVLDASGQPQGEGLLLANGQSLTLRAGETAVFDGLPVGAAYAVYEEYEPGYAAASTGASGTILTQGSAAVFTNREETPPASAYGTLTVTKRVDRAEEPPAESAPPENAVPAPGEPGGKDAADGGTDPGGAAATRESARPDGETRREKPQDPASAAEVGAETPAEDAQEQFVFQVQIGNDPEAEYTYTIDVGEPQTLRSGGTLTLRDGQSAVFADCIPVGSWYAVTEQPAEGYASSATGSTGVMTADGAEAAFVNTPRQDAGQAVLRIRKELAEGTSAQGAFPFVVCIGRDPDARYTCTVDGEPREIGYGDTLLLEAGQTAEFAALPAGTWYSVTELTPQGYSCSSQYATGTVPQEGCTALFVNRAEQAGGVGSLTIEKSVMGRDDAGADVFECTVELGADRDTEYRYTRYGADGSAEAGTLKSGQTLQLSHGERAVFDGLPQGLFYNIVETDCWADGYVTRTDGSSGTIVPGGTTARFENHWVGAAEQPTVRIAGTKRWQHGEVPEELRPRAAIIFVRLGEATVAQQTVNSQSGWEFAFELPKFLADGVTPAEYTLWEEPVAGYEAEWSQPETDGDGNLTQDVTNTASGAAWYVPKVVKQVTGNPTGPAETFRFLLTAVTPDAPMPPAAGDDGAEVRISGEGEAAFDAIWFETEGSYEYRISELAGENPEYEYDPTEYRLTIRAEERQPDGALTATAELLDGQGTPCEKAAFTNAYVGPAPTATPGATETPAMPEPTASPTASPEPTAPATPTATPLPPEGGEETAAPSAPPAETAGPEDTPAGPTQQPTSTPAQASTVPRTGDGLALGTLAAGAAGSLAGLLGLGLSRLRAGKRTADGRRKRKKR